MTSTTAANISDDDGASDGTFSTKSSGSSGVIVVDSVIARMRCLPLQTAGVCIANSKIQDAVIGREERFLQIIQPQPNPRMVMAMANVGRLLSILAISQQS